MARSYTLVSIVVLASCILLATAVPVNSNRRGLKSIATAQENGETGYAGKQEPDTATGYGQYREEQLYEEKRYDESDDDGDEKQYYGERPSGPDYYHHQAEDYPKVEAKHLCLQESKRVTAAGLQTSTFRCCTPGDKPDSCLDPTEPDYDGSRDSLEPDFISNLLSNPPASCTWQTGAGCPSWTQACFTMELNCTVSSSAGECGCPYKSGFKFQARGYVAKIDAKGCEQAYVPPTVGTGRRLAAVNYARVNETYYTGDAWLFRGKINMIATTGGYKEAKGRVEFVTDFLNGVAVNITRGDGYNDDDDEYHGRSEGRNYGRDSERNYGRDSERKYDRDDERNYDRDDERNYDRDDERNYDRDDERNYGRDDERNYGERRDNGPYEAKAQGAGYGGYEDEYSGSYDRPWLKAGNMKITLYETEYY